MSPEVRRQILSHFESASTSTFLTSLLLNGSRKIDKSEMNAFLYHLHRRSNVMHRVLAHSQHVIAATFLQLRLCSKRHSKQMSSYCTDLSAKAQEIRDDSQHLLDMHISLQSFRTNELMAILTRFSILFTPCAFLASVYGMNFQYMPELHMVNGYTFFWLTCAAITIAIQLFFYYKGLFY